MEDFDIKEWSCPTCTYKNTNHYYVCEVCNHENDKWQLVDLYPEFKTENKIEKVYNVFGKKNKILLPVLACSTYEQFCVNIDNLYPFTIIEDGLSGIFLISVNCDIQTLDKVYKYAKTKYPHLWIGINLLVYNPNIISKFLEDNNPDGLWFDKSFITDKDYQNIPLYFLNMFKKCKWDGLYFGSVLFKYQEKKGNDRIIIQNALLYTDIVTTSGISTGIAIEDSKLELVKSITNNNSLLATASGNSIDTIVKHSSIVNIFLFRSSFVDDNDNYKIDCIKQLLSSIKSL